jgi:predicted enzyme related to lactoylglutathione lyase
MKPHFHGLRTTIYKVTDITKAKAWYSQAFGVAPYFDEPFYVGFNIGGYELGLQPDFNTPISKVGCVIAYWGVDDAIHSYNRLLELGASEFEKPTEVGGGIVVAAVKDPWGNVLGIIYNPTFKLPD